MISIEAAQKTVLERIDMVQTEKVPLLQALGRVIPHHHLAPWDLPPADNSAMDGYAFCRTTAGERLRVTGFLPAGEVRLTAVPAGEAIKIMTGAPIPPGCDTVVPLEEVEVDGDSISLLHEVPQGMHLRRKGEDVRLGQVVVAAGSVMRPQEIGLLSAIGVATVEVYRAPRVAILSTGDELLPPGTVPTPGKIIDCNSYALAAQVLEAGGEAILLGIAADSLADTAQKIKAGVEADFLVANAGVSVGEKDVVKPAIESLGGDLAFWKVDMKPGKPLAFGTVGGKPVFALPGNPVAAMVCFELFVRPALLKARGHRGVSRPVVKALLLEEVHNRATRPHLMRGMVSRQEDRYVVRTTGNQCSGRLSSMTEGNGLLKLPPESLMPRGTEVDVMLLDRNFETEWVQGR